MTMPTDTPALGRFGHHPDPTIDFCVEVEEIDAIHYDVRTGIAKDKEDERNRRISRAMSFRVGGDEKAVAAKDRLRVIEREAAPPNPVAEVAARLREAADNIERARMSGIVENLAGWEQRHARDAADLLERQKAEIERLSRERDTVIEECIAVVGKPRTIDAMRGDVAVPDCAQDIIADLRALQGQPRERDTGVPEGWREAVQRIRNTSMQQALAARVPECGHFGSIAQDADWLANEMAAAPQPPTVSQGWQDISTAPRDGTWFLICREDEGPESYEVGCFDPQTWSAYEPAENGLYRKVERVVNEWRGFNNFHRATHWTALLGHPGDPDLSTLTRERDQAREALAPFAKVLDAMEHDNQLCEEEIDSVLAGTGIVPSDLRRARSVLHPDTEVSS